MQDEIADFLAHVPLLAGLPAEARSRLADKAGDVALPAGAWLFRQDDVGESAYVVRSGRLEFVDERASLVFGEIGPGGVVGELAVLLDQPRSASVRAHRDSALLELRREDLDDLLRSAPEFALALTRWLAQELADVRPSTPRVAPIVSIAMIGLDERAPVAAVSDRLASGLRRFGTLEVVDESRGRTVDELLEVTHRCVRDHKRVILTGTSTDPDDGWLQSRIREADLLVAVAGSTPIGPWRSRAGILRGCELLVAGGRLDDATIEELAPRHVAVRSSADELMPTVDALARRLAGRSLGLVLSGGGARALAHIGVYEELHAAGLRFDRVGGASLGSLVAGAIAMGWEPDEIHDVFARSLLRSPTRDYTLPLAAFLRGVKARALLEELAGDVRLEELTKSFFCVSCDIIERRLIVHRTGPARDALYASLAIPGVFPPLRTAQGGLLVDGGVLNNLPVEVMARAGEGPVLASDVSANDGRWAARRRVPTRMALGARRVLTGTEDALPRIGETLLRSFLLGSTDTDDAARAHAALTITPAVEGIGLMDWKQLGRMRELGRRAAADALQAADLAALRS